ncbi:MAG TPA: hypothetical protein VFP20_07745 [Bacteroidales bacterium]|nr:hypothetical protein [Bacteroidales bacterium]
MKRIALLVAILCLFQLSYSQKIHEISLIQEKISLNDRKFYIDSVIDNRADKSTIGIVQKGLFNAKHPAQLLGGFTNSLQTYFDNALPKENDQIPIIIRVNTFKISELTRATDEFGFADIALDFYRGNDLLFSNKQHFEVTSMDVTRLHEENIREALRKSIAEFNQSEWLTKAEDKRAEVIASEPITVVSNTSNQLSLTPTVVQENENETVKRNSLAIGYQIGGYSLIGFDYEIRMLDYVGVHFGAGFSGFTYGLMFHTSPKRNSPYFNVSYKDGGFGVLNAAGVEYGGKWVFNKKSGFGLIYQFGIVKILKINQDFADILFSGRETPPFMTSMGIGLCW